MISAFAKDFFNEARFSSSHLGIIENEFPKIMSVEYFIVRNFQVHANNAEEKEKEVTGKCAFVESNVVICCSRYDYNLSFIYFVVFFFHFIVGNFYMHEKNAKEREKKEGS